MEGEVKLSGLAVWIFRDAAKQVNQTRYIPLPRELWKSAGTCNCKHCGGKESFWDTLAVPSVTAHANYHRTWTCHAPELQPDFRGERESHWVHERV